MISLDERLRAIGLFLVPAFVGHTIQQLGEDEPWSELARLRYYSTPGWHLHLPPAVIGLIALGLAVSVIGLAARRSRRWLLAVVVFYLLHYLTYPFRIRNHMTHMFFELSMLGGCWLIGWASRQRGLSRRVDRWAVNGMAAVLCVTYFFAGLHKINDNFLSLDPERSPAVQGLTTFFIYGDLGSSPPTWVRRVATLGTVIIEMVAPIVAWRVHRLRITAVITLMLFHFPHVAVMDVADYPMIASVFYPALFSQAQFRLILRHAGVHRFTIAGAIVGVGMQLWFMPWWGGLTVFGIFVMALWGWAAGAMLTMAGARRASVG